MDRAIPTAKGRTVAAARRVRRNHGRIHTARLPLAEVQPSGVSSLPRLTSSDYLFRLWLRNMTTVSRRNRSYENARSTLAPTRTAQEWRGLINSSDESGRSTPFR